MKQVPFGFGQVGVCFGDIEMLTEMSRREMGDCIRKQEPKVKQGQAMTENV